MVAGKGGSPPLSLLIKFDNKFIPTISFPSKLLCGW